MNRRRLMANKGLEGFVDLGLPSGTLWAKGNIVKNGSKYSIGEETDYGAYFSWGNIDGHNQGYDFSSTAYNSTAGSSVNTNIASYDTVHDTAFARLGSPWHLPSKTNFQELKNYTDTEWTTINGIKGRKFMKKTDHSVYIFFPAAGICSGRYLNDRGTNGNYWSSSYGGRSTGFSFFFNSDSVDPNFNAWYRSSGLPVRAVICDEFVDLGLPSGLLWCTHNIGAISPIDYGYYFSWGNVYGYEKGSGYDFSDEEYESTNGYNLDGDIPVNSTYDIAQKVMGSPWRLPTKNEFVELCDNTDSEWVINYNGTGVKGYKFMKKSDHSVYIFFPACGYYYETSLENENLSPKGNYWSSTYHSSDDAYNLSFNSNGVYPDDTGGYRSFGRTGRAVMPKEGIS